MDSSRRSTIRRSEAARTTSIYYDPAASYDPGRTVDGVGAPVRKREPGNGDVCLRQRLRGLSEREHRRHVDLVTSYPDTVVVQLQAQTPPSPPIWRRQRPLNLAYGSICRLNGRRIGAGRRRVRPSHARRSRPATTIRTNQRRTGSSTACASATAFSTAPARFGRALLLHDLQASVLLQQGWRRLRTGRARIATTRRGIPSPATAPIRDAGRRSAFTRRHLRPLRTDPRPDLRRGDGQLREVVHVLPNADSCDEDGDRHRLLGASSRTRAWASIRYASARCLALLDFTTGTPRQRVPQRRPLQLRQQGTWFNAVYGRKVSILHALAGRASGASASISRTPATPGLPGAVDPLDPVTGKCQPNYHLLSTDGYWNHSDRRVGRTDRRHKDKDPSRRCRAPVPDFTPGSPFPRPITRALRQRPTTLADVAMYYWIHDLRPALDNKVKDTHRALAARHAVRLVDRCAGTSCRIPRHRRRSSPAAARWPIPHQASRATSSSTPVPEVDRRPLARGAQQPRQVLQRPESAGAGRRASSSRLR